MKPSLIPTASSPTLYSWLILALLGLIWGSSYILIKKALIIYSPIQLASLRVTISAIAFLPVLGYHLRNIDWSKLRYLLVVGFAGSFLPAFLFAYAQTEISSSMTGVLSSLTPLFTLATGILLFRAPLIWAKVLGVLVGLAGAVLLLILGKSAGMQGNMTYGILVIFASLFYSLSANTVSSYLRDINAITISAVSFVLIGIPSIIMLFSTDVVTVLAEVDGAWLAFGYIVLLALFGTVLASVLFFKLVQITSAIFASTVSYLIPLVAVAWGFLDEEIITIYHIFGMILILIGVYLSRQ